MKYFRPITKDQQIALKNVYVRKWQNEPGIAPPKETYRAFRKRAFNNTLLGCVMVEYCGMWLGIEKDGHTHS